MSAARIPTMAGTLAAVLLIALTLGWFGPQLDQPAQALTVAESQDADVIQCRADHGPNATAVQLPDGSHRCTDKHGRRLRNTTAATVVARSAP